MFLSSDQLTEAEMVARLNLLKLYPGSDPNATVKSIYDEVVNSFHGLVEQGYGFCIPDVFYANHKD